MFGTTAHIFAVFNNVNGLQAGNNVRYSGVNIGTVQSIEMVSDTSIKVDMSINSKMLRHIKQNAVATIGTDGLVGSMILNILPGNENAPGIQSGSQIRSYSRIRTEDLLKTLNVTNENAALLTVDLLKITKEITQGHGSIGVLLNDKEMAANLKSAAENLKNSSARASASLREIEYLIKGLNDSDNAIGLIKDPDTGAQLKRILSRFESASISLDSTLSDVNTLVHNAKDGKGAINYLSNNPAAVQKIDSILDGMNSASKKLNEDLEALQHNVFFRGYFKSQKKAAKE